MNAAQKAILCSALRSIARIMDIHSRQLQRQIGVSAPQLSILIYLAEASPQPLSKIAHSIHMSAASISVNTARLLENGLVARQRSPRDKRQVLLHLTAKGRDVLRSGFSPLPENLIRNFDNGLPDWEKNMLLSALQKLTQLMQSTDNH